MYGGILSKEVTVNLFKLITRHILTELMRLGLKGRSGGFGMHTHI
jgi:hypothetical protein